MTPKLCQLTPKWSKMTTKLSIDQGILLENEQSRDQQTNMPGPRANTRGPTCQDIRTNMPSHKDQPTLTQYRMRISNKQEILNCPT